MKTYSTPVLSVYGSAVDLIQGGVVANCHPSIPSAPLSFSGTYDPCHPCCPVSH